MQLSAKAQMGRAWKETKYFPRRPGLGAAKRESATRKTTCCWCRGLVFKKNFPRRPRKGRVRKEGNDLLRTYLMGKAKTEAKYFPRRGKKSTVFRKDLF